MDVRRLLLTLLLLALIVDSTPAEFDPARTFLTTAFRVSDADVRRLDSGAVVSRTLDTKNGREVATLGIARIKTSPSLYVDRLADIVTFKRAEGVLQIGRFSSPPRLDDLTAVSLDDADVNRLRHCRVEDCKLRLSAEDIERVRREIDWRAPDAARQTTLLVRRALLDYVIRYQQRGAGATMEYAGRVPRLNVGREFASLLDADTVTARYAPQLRRHLLDYPSSDAEQIRDFVYWSKELVRGRPVISMTHVATAAAIDDSPVAYAIGSKQIYAMHYYDASLGLTLLVPDPTAASPTTFVVYLNRSRIDLFDGPFGGVARKIVAGKARTLVAEQLQRLQRTFAGLTPEQPRETR